MIKQTGDKNIAIGKNEGQIHFHFNINNIDPKQYGTLIEELTQDLQRQNSEIEKRENTIEIHEETIKELREIKKSLKAEKEEIQVQLDNKTISETEAQNKLAEIEQKAHEIQKQLDQKSQKITTLETKNRQLRLDLLGKSQEINQLNARIKSLEETKVQATKLKQQTKDPKIKQGLELIEQDQAHRVEELLPDEDLNKEKIQIRERHKEDYRQLAQKYIVKALGAKARFEFALADKYYQKATQECSDAEFWFAYAHFLNEQNHKNKAISYYKKALAQLKNENAKGEEYATVLNNLGALYYAKNEFKEAEKCYKESLEIRRGLAEKNPESFASDVAMTLNNLGLLYSDKNEFEKGEKCYKEFLEIYQGLAEKNPESFASYVASSLNNLGNLYSDKNEFEKGEKCYKESLKIYQGLAEKNPESFASDVAMTLNNLGNLYSAKNEFEKGEKCYKESLEIYQGLAEKNPESFASDVARSLNNLGNLYYAKNEFEKGEKCYKESLKIYQGLAEKNPESFASDVAMTLNNLGNLYSAKNEFEKGEKCYKESLEIYQGLAEKNPESFASDVARSLNNLGNLYSAKNEFEKGEKCYKESLEIYQGLAEKNPEVYDLGVCMTSLNICILYEEYTQEGKLHYASLALDLLEDVAERLQKYPNIPQANHYKNTGLIPLQDYFRQHQGHLYEGAFEVLPEEKEEYEIFDIFQEAEQHRTKDNTQEAQNLYKKCIAEWAEIPLSENDDLDTYAESHLRLAQLQGTRTDMAITPALDNYQEALRLFLLQTDDDTTWEYLLETGYFYALELKKGIWLGTRKRIKREIKAIQNQVFEALSDKNLNETTQDWKQKLAEVLDKK